MDEFGETPTIYVWPKDHVEGDPLPEDFYSRLWTVLRENGFEGEPT
jgi:hypothetical protein